MIPRAEILKQINRFYDAIEELTAEIEKSEEPNPELHMKYFNLTAKIGTKMQYAISELKDNLDCLEEGNID